jgi:hypothetical protein
MAKPKHPAQLFQLKITLRDIKPPIWRRVQVKDCTLAKLHDIIQAGMGWYGCHLHAFEIGGEEFSEPDPDGMMEGEDSRKVKLSQVLTAGFKKFTYVYDFGDNWRHIIQVEKVLDAEPGVHYPLCLAGKRACPPEDCGGPWGYQNFLEAIQDPKHREHEDMMEWSGGGFDPEDFDIEVVNEELGAIR